MTQNLSHFMKVMLLASFFIFPLSSFTTEANAQSTCGIQNKAFKAGELISYDLYFNWQFVWVKVGTASMQTVVSTWQGEPAYRASLITRGNNKLDNVFMMRDTLLSYCSLTDLSPVYYRKGVREGKRYYVDELWYSYPNQKNHIKMRRLSHRGEETIQEKEYDECVYDMMSIFLRARNFDASTLNQGDIINLPITDARHRQDTWLKYMGKEDYKVEYTGEKFRCLVFGFFEKEDDGRTNELIRFYVTDDQNHMPVMLDMHLSFGSAKAYLKGYQGVRSPLTSKLQ